MKPYTDIEQSKKLAEILPLESADMYWKNGISDKFIQCFNPFVSDDSRSNVDFDYDVPCWSLAALLEVIPKYIGDNYVLRMDYNKDFSIWYDEVVGCGVSNELPDITKDSIIDATYEMIIKLHEQNLI